VRAASSKSAERTSEGDGTIPAWATDSAGAHPTAPKNPPLVARFGTSGRVAMRRRWRGRAVTGASERGGQRSNGGSALEAQGARPSPSRAARGESHVERRLRGRGAHVQSANERTSPVPEVRRCAATLRMPSRSRPSREARPTAHSCARR
jgi:hypothetical protein